MQWDQILSRDNRRAGKSRQKPTAVMAESCVILTSLLRWRLHPSMLALSLEHLPCQTLQSCAVLKRFTRNVRHCWCYGRKLSYYRGLTHWKFWLSTEIRTRLHLIKKRSAETVGLLSRLSSSDHIRSPTRTSVLQSIHTVHPLDCTCCDLLCTGLQNGALCFQVPVVSLEQRISESWVAWLNFL